MRRLRNDVHQPRVVATAARLPAPRGPGEDGFHDWPGIPTAWTAPAPPPAAAITSSCPTAATNSTAAQVDHSLGTPWAAEHL